MIGDGLAERDSALQEPMALRVGRHAVATDAASLRAAYPEANSHLVVFVHGLMGTESPWWINADYTGRSYGDRLERERACTAVYVRYNTGLHISENGKHLDTLLQQLVESWPVPVTRITLVG
ncbi:MAG: alpha/beta hydrolase, partial [Solirubrobacterales bacterium]